ncbi:MAG: peptidoglycan/xylan/chitin deacetylase (PgdA/CDA1 family) [Phenylobacterium sp.]|jgi:peptidoglycan/xylan/chitin deacetylase (PgdA/CDA1 family)
MKTLVLYILKFTGIFYLCRRLMANKTLILAYHGFEILDETQFDDQLFIKPVTLKRRLDYLKKHCNVIPLSQLVEANEAQAKQKNKIAITIDDGWYSTLTVAAPMLKHYEAPYTVYLTTENVLDNQPIFHVALRLILELNIGKQLQYKHSEEFALDVMISLASIATIMADIVTIKHQKNDTHLLFEVAKALEFDFASHVKHKTLTLMSPAQVKAIKALGADIQLHTHTHNTPLDSFSEFAEEINVNKAHIIDMVGQAPEHHCYPSGVYNQDSLVYLRQLGVKTATTCYAGFCTPETERLELPRFLDGENISQIVFEAEVSGVLEVFRQLRKFKFSAARGQKVQAG